MAAPRFRIDIFLRLIQEHSVSSLVDLGCGSGALLLEIGEKFPNIKLCGIDLSPSQIQFNREKNPQIDWQVSDLGVPLTAGENLLKNFSCVIASEIIEHLDDPKRLLENAYQLADPNGGLLFLSTQSGRVWETERNVGHTRHFTSQEMSDLLQKCRWKVIRVWNAGFPFHDLSKWYANFNPSRSMRLFGGESYGPYQNAICFLLRVAFKLNSQKKGSQLFAVAQRES